MSLEILKQEDRKPIMKLQRKRLAEELQHGVRAVKIGQKVDVIKERDLHQERSQRLVALDVKPGSWLRKKEGDRRLYGRMEMTSTDPGRQSRVVAIQG